MNGSEVTFDSDTLGVRFHVPRANPGSEKLGLQSSDVVKVRAKIRFTVVSPELTLRMSGKSSSRSE
jgi:hypothetical protein